MTTQNNSFFQNLAKGVQQKVKKQLANPYKEVNLNWLSLRYYKNIKSNKERSHTIFGAPFYFINSQEFILVLKEIFIEKMYDINLPPNPYILDCGANIGVSVLYLKKNYPTAEIVAFEPNEINCSLLEKNVSSQSLTNVTIKKQAVWTYDGTISFSSNTSLSNKITIEETNLSTEQVPCTRLKNFLIRPIDFLKIDIEGAEFNVLKDIKDELHWVSNLFLEYHGNFNQNNELCEMLNLINQAGMKFYIKEAAPIFPTPFNRTKGIHPYEVQLNIFCFR